MPSCHFVFHIALVILLGLAGTTSQFFLDTDSIDTNQKKIESAAQYCKSMVLAAINNETSFASARESSAQHIILISDNSDNLIAAKNACSKAWCDVIDIIPVQDLTSSATNSTMKSIIKGRPMKAPSHVGLECWPGIRDKRHAWSQCCEAFKPSDAKRPSYCHNNNNNAKQSSCCVIGHEKGSELVLPSLMETSLSVKIHNCQRQRVLQISQDGFLRAFDVAGVLWPAGYLLSQVVGDEGNYGRIICPPSLSGGRRRILELGAGVGLPSVTAATCCAAVTRNRALDRDKQDDSGGGVHVIATDIAKHSLALVTENAARNGVGHMVTARRMDWNKNGDIALLLAEEGPFDVVMGASLRYEEWDDRLWRLLRAVCTLDCTILLAHSTVSFGGKGLSPPVEPSSGLREMRRISGTEYGMFTSAGLSSDVEVIVLQPDVDFLTVKKSDPVFLQSCPDL